MWWAGRAQTLDVWLGRSFAAWSRGAGIGRRKEGLAGPESGLLWLLEEQGRERLPLRWTVFLGSGLARPFVFVSPRGLKSLGEVCAVASSMASEQSGWSEDARVWVSEPDQEGRRLAVAAVASALQALEACARDVRARLVSVRPGWARLTGEVADGSRARGNLLIASDPDGCIALAGDRQRWWWGGALDLKDVQTGGDAWKARLAMRLEAPADTVAFALQGVDWVMTPPATP